MDSKPLMHSSSLNTSPSYHLLSTYIFVIWSLFIGLTVAVHERAHHVTWDSSRVAAGDNIPWMYRSGLGLPSTLRTIFIQAHGPITAMHLARLAVSALDTSWASPRTWTEVFWLANRRWSGPVGLAETGWAMASRRRAHMSLGFCLFALISIVALGTPVVLTRAYPSVAGQVNHTISVEDRAPTPSWDGGDDHWDDQVQYGYIRWATGAPPSVLMPLNAYTGLETPLPAAGGDWFIASDSNKSELTLNGIRVVGGCEVVNSTSTGPDFFADLCMKEFNTTLNLDNVVTTEMQYDNGRDALQYWVLTNASSCSNISPIEHFGRMSQSSALFRLWSEDGNTPETLLRCQATSGLGTAFVNGRNMTFSHFTHSSPYYNESALSEFRAPLDPIAVITQSDLLFFQQSYVSKARSIESLDKGYNPSDLLAAAMWDGVLAMATELWVVWRYDPVQLSGIQRIDAIGIRRNEKACLALTILLSIWFAGMLVATFGLLRPTWSGTFDSYAVARMLQHHPVPSKTGEVWNSGLEENEDLQQPFKIRQWGSNET